MITHFQSYADFINNLTSFYSSNKFLFDAHFTIDGRFSHALMKMIFLDVDSIFDLLRPLYHQSLGRPAKNQIQILRSLILMAHYRTYSIDKWVSTLNKDSSLASLCGFENNVSSVSSHYDFINRLFQGQKYSRNDFILDDKPYKKPDRSQKPSKGCKWKNYDDLVTVQLYDHFLQNINHAENLDEYVFLQLFDILGVQFSKKYGLIEDNITISGDGTCFHGHAHCYGRNIKLNDTYKRYSDLDADWGWDSDKNMFYFGYTGYSISTINRKYNIDLPIFLTMAKASQHDAITSMTALAQLCSINNCLHFSHYCLDCASDNISTHRLVYSLGILPVIDVNHRLTSGNIYEPYQGISENGRPICMAGHECIRDGYDKKRFRHKFRCPFAQRKENTCPMKEQCTKSKYGRVFHVKSKDDLRLFGVVQYNSDEWKTIYKDRTSCERINNRIINDYKFKDNFMRGKSHNFLMLMMVGINLHLDALIKVQSL